MKASKITALDFFDDLTSPYARKWFFAGFVLLAALSLILIVVTHNQLVEWPKTREVIVAILTEIASGALIILLFYAFYVYFIGPNTAVREVSVTRPQDISERMRTLPIGARHYMFWGRSGSFFRAYPLLKLDEEATENKRNIQVDVLLPDPSDDRLVKSYRDILRSLGEDAGQNPLLPNVLATCIACAIIAANNKYIDIRIHLSRFLPGFRIDLSDNGGILTQDDKKKSALYFDFGSEFYDMFHSTLANERDVSRVVGWDREAFYGLKLEEKSCNGVTLNAFGINVPDVDGLQREVAMLITKRPHRYK